MKKNDEIILDIIDITSEGSGVAKQDGMAVFVPMTAIGDTVKARILKERLMPYLKIQNPYVWKKNMVTAMRNMITSMGTMVTAMTNMMSTFGFRQTMLWNFVKTLP